MRLTSTRRKTKSKQCKTDRMRLGGDRVISPPKAYNPYTSRYVYFLTQHPNPYTFGNSTLLLAVSINGRYLYIAVSIKGFLGWENHFYKWKNDRNTYRTRTDNLGKGLHSRVSVPSFKCDRHRGIFSELAPGRDQHRGIFSGFAPGLKVRLTLSDGA